MVVRWRVGEFSVVNAGMELMTSQTLLAHIANGSDVEAWALFERIYAPFIMRYLTRCSVPASDIDDVCQEILLRTFQGIRTFEHNGRQGAFRTWLRRLVAQAVWRYFQERQARREELGEGDSAVELAADPHDDIARQWEQEHDRYLVDHMLRLVRREFSDTSWQAFQLVVLEGLTPSATAGRLGISLNAVFLAKSRIMRRLRTLGDGLVDAIDLE